MAPRTTIFSIRATTLRPTAIPPQGKGVMNSSLRNTEQYPLLADREPLKSVGVIHRRVCPVDKSTQLRVFKGLTAQAKPLVYIMHIIGSWRESPLSLRTYAGGSVLGRKLIRGSWILRRRRGSQNIAGHPSGRVPWLPETWFLAWISRFQLGAYVLVRAEVAGRVLGL